MRRWRLLIPILYLHLISCGGTGSSDYWQEEGNNDTTQITNTVFISSVQVVDWRDPYDDGLIGNKDGLISAQEIVDLLIEFKNLPLFIAL